jgi:hypothetical protein
MRERASVAAAVGYRLTSTWKRWLVMGALAASMSAAVAGCAVSEDDLTRWQTTEHGPQKLYAVVTHSKFSWQLRADAAMSLVVMKPRDGNRVGLRYLVDGIDDPDEGTMPGALTILQDDARKRIVGDMTDKLVEGMKLAIPAPRADGCYELDPSIPYKDAAFAMLTHDPPLVSEDANKQKLNDALLNWVRSGFEQRIDNSAQEYPTDKVMSYLGPSSVETLPALVTETSEKVARIAGLVQSLGSDDTKLKMSQALVDLAKVYEGSDWIGRATQKVKDVNAARNTPASDDQIKAQVRETQKNKFLDPQNGVFVTMHLIGGRPIVDYCVDFALNRKSLDLEMRKGALAAVEGQMFKGDPKDPSVKAQNQKDADRLFAMVADESNADDLRGLALKRLQEAPGDMMKSYVVPKLYSLFTGKKWQTRRAAATLVLMQMTTSDIKEFVSHLPTTPDQRMSMTEAIQYGSAMSVLDAKGGPKPHDVLSAYLGVKDIGPKLVAIGSYFQGTNADKSALAGAKGDNAPVPKCDTKDQCGWQDTGCMVPKEGGKPGETDKKLIGSVGDFVTYCILPSMGKGGK